MQRPSSTDMTQSSLSQQWQIGFGAVRHSRRSAVSNSFSYRCFFVDGDADSMLGNPRGDWLFGVNRRAAISMRITDHGDGKPNLKWLHEMLEDAGLPKASSIRFRGFPRVLGYAFKPVSFWFCADESGHDFAIIAEVNNTFGERHCYLLSNSGSEHGNRIKNGELFTATKAFHVSPFRKVSGHYQFRFIRRDAHSAARIDHYETDRDVLQTSISGIHVPLNHAACFRALFFYPLFTVGVIARIHWQAFRLWVKRVPVTAKPLPPNQFVTSGSDLKEK